MATQVIQSGSTLSGIAKSNNTTVSALLSANPQITNQNKIYAGANINIPSATPVSSSPITNSSSAQAQTAQNVSNLNTYMGTINVSPTGVTGVTGNPANAGSTSVANNANNSINPDPIGSPSNTNTTDLMSTINSLKTDQANFQSNVMNTYNQLRQGNDELYKKTLTDIETRFGSLRTQLNDINSRFTGKTQQNQYAIGGFRYTPQQADGMVQQAEIEGVNRLAELEVERSSLITKAQKEMRDQDEKALDQSMKLIQANFDNRVKVFDRMQDFAKSITNQVTEQNNRAILATKTATAKIESSFPTILSKTKNNPKMLETLLQQVATQTGASIDEVKGIYQNVADERNVKATKNNQVIQKNNQTITKNNQTIQKNQSSTKVINGVTYKKVAGGWQKVN